MSAALWTAADAAQATGGNAQGDWVAGSVSIDSRTLAAGALYVAIKGENADGHAYVKNALERGAVAALVSQKIEGVAPEKMLLVADTAKALSALGNAARARSRAKIIGVTGSIGKTTTKEMIALMCSNFGRTYATKGNLNNHFGVPLMLANMPLDTEFGIFEMGMNHAGEITALSNMVRPHVAIITTVEAVHLEFFESVAGIADAKSEIFHGLTVDGIAILNRDNPYFDRCLKHAEQFQARRIIRFGRHAEADVRLMSQADVDAGLALTAQIDGNAISYTLGASGEGAVAASLVSLAVASALGLDVVCASESLAKFEEVDGRGKLTRVVFEGKKMWWMDDSYNASPASMKAAFKKLSHVAARNSDVRRSVAVLGDMLELGAQSKQFHLELAQALQAEGIQRIYAAGAFIKPMFDALPESMRGAHVAHADALEDMLRRELCESDVVLFKGSHGSKIYALVEKLQS
jgi:UDP-N-acetylmuramoyl-tripeptide--D-alanyl-D-alanine ligase